MAAQQKPRARDAQDVADEHTATRTVEERDARYFHEYAERTVLYALIRGVSQVVDLDPNIFFRAAHQVIADHIIMLREAGREPNMVTLSDDLIEKQKMEAAGGAGYVSDIYDQRPTSDEVAYALRIVERNYYRRRAEEARAKLTQASANWADPADVQRLLGECQYWEGLQNGAAAEIRPTHFRFLSVEQLDAMPPDKGLIGDVLYENSIACLYGPSGRWKSFVVLDWALCIATGIDWLGKATKPGRVVYVAAEGSGGVRKRRRAWAQRHPEVTDYGLFQLVPQPVNLMDPEQVRAFIEDTKAQGDIPAAIFFDTLARSMAGGNFNDPKDANLVTDSLGQIKAAFPGVCMLTVAHTGKDAARGIVGAYQFYANMDTVVLVNGKEGQERIEPGETIKLVSEKPKENESFDDITLTAEKVSWATNEEGTEWDSSLVIVGAGSATYQAKPPKLSDTSQTALMALAASETGLRANDWMRATAIKPGTFKTWAKPDLLRRGLICEVGGVFRLTQTGNDHLAGLRGGRVLPFRPA